MYNRKKYFLECLDLMEAILISIQKATRIEMESELELNEELIFFELSGKFSNEKMNEETIKKFCSEFLSRDIVAEQKNKIFFLSQFGNIIFYLNKKMIDERKLLNKKEIVLKILEEEVRMDLLSFLISIGRKIKIQETTFEKLKKQKKYFLNESFFESFFDLLIRKRSHLKNEKLIELLLEGGLKKNNDSLEIYKYFCIPSKEQYKKIAKKKSLLGIKNPINFSFSILRNDSREVKYSNDILFCFMVVKFINLGNECHFETMVEESLFSSYKFLGEKYCNYEYLMESYVIEMWSSCVVSQAVENYFDPYHDSEIIGKNASTSFFFNECLQKVTSRDLYDPYSITIQISENTKIIKELASVTQTRIENDQLFKDFEILVGRSRKEHTLKEYKNQFKPPLLENKLCGDVKSLSKTTSIVVYCLVNMFAHYLFMYIMEKCVIIDLSGGNCNEREYKDEKYNNKSFKSPVLSDAEETLLVASLLEDYKLLSQSYPKWTGIINYQVAISKIENSRKQVEYECLEKNDNDDDEHKSSPTIIIKEEQHVKIETFLRTIVTNVNNTKIVSGGIIFSDYNIGVDNINIIYGIDTMRVTQVYYKLVLYFKNISEIIKNNENLLQNNYRKTNSNLKMIKFDDNKIKHFVEITKSEAFEPIVINNLKKKDKAVNMILDKLLKNNDTYALHSLITLSNDLENCKQKYVNVTFCTQFDGINVNEAITKTQILLLMQLLSKKYFENTLKEGVDYIVLEEEIKFSHCNLVRDDEFEKSIEIDLHENIEEINDIGKIGLNFYNLEERSDLLPFTNAKMIIKEKLLQHIQRVFVVENNNTYQKKNLAMIPPQLVIMQNLYSKDVLICKSAIALLYNTYFSSHYLYETKMKIDVEFILRELELTLHLFENPKQKIDELFNVDHFSKIQNLCEFNSKISNKCEIILQKVLFNENESNSFKEFKENISKINNKNDNNVIDYYLDVLFNKRVNAKFKNNNQIPFSLIEVVKQSLNVEYQEKFLELAKKITFESNGSCETVKHYVVTLNKFTSQANMIFSLHRMLQNIFYIENEFIFPNIIYECLLKKYIIQDKQLTTIFGKCMSKFKNNKRKNTESCVNIVQNKMWDNYYKCEYLVDCTLQNEIIEYFEKEKIYCFEKQLSYYLEKNNSILLKLMDIKELVNIFKSDVSISKNNEQKIPKIFRLNMILLIMYLVKTTNQIVENYNLLFTLLNKQPKLFLKKNKCNYNVEKINYLMENFQSSIKKRKQKKIILKNGESMIEMNELLQIKMEEKKKNFLLESKVQENFCISKILGVTPKIITSMLHGMENMKLNLLEQEKIFTMSTFFSPGYNNIKPNNIPVCNEKAIPAYFKTTEKLIEDLNSINSKNKESEMYYDLPFVIFLNNNIKSTTLYRSEVFPMSNLIYSHKSNYTQEYKKENSNIEYTKKYFIYKKKGKFFANYYVNQKTQTTSFYSKSNVLNNNNNTNKNWFQIIKYKPSEEVGNIYSNPINTETKKMLIPRPLHLNNTIMDMLYFEKHKII